MKNTGILKRGLALVACCLIVSVNSLTVFAENDATTEQTTEQTTDQTTTEKGKSTLGDLIDAGLSAAHDIGTTISAEAKDIKDDLERTKEAIQNGDIKGGIENLITAGSGRAVRATQTALDVTVNPILEANGKEGVDLISKLKVADSSALQNVATAAEIQEKVVNHAKTLDEVKQDLKKCSAYSGYTVERLTAMAWAISVEITRLKALGFSQSAACGVLANMKSESGFNPYILQIVSGTDKSYNMATSWDIFSIDANITLKIDDNGVAKSPYEIESDQAKAESLMVAPSRINMDLSSVIKPIAGIGLIQFTDCSTDYTKTHSYNDLIKGFRRSNCINEWSGLTSDPWSAVLLTQQYQYWTASTSTDNTETHERTDEEGNTETFELTTTSDNAKLSVGQSNKIVMASADQQLLFMDANDAPNCWMTTEVNRGTLKKYGLIGDEDMTYQEYKNFSGTAQEAAMLWCAYMERPGANQSTVVETRGNNVKDDELVKTVCELTEQYYGSALDLDSIASYGVDPKSALMETEYGGGIYSSDNLQSHNAALAQSGYLNESQAADYMVQAEGTISEELIDMAKRAYLNQKELSSLIEWENEVKVNSFENVLVLTGRRIVIFLGILLMVWSLLFYLAYWFDTLNNVVYMDLVGKLSFGHLCIADVAEHSTYFNKEEPGQKKKTLLIHHRDAFMISALGFAISTFFVTGLIFKWLYAIVMKIYSFLQ